MNIEPVAAVRAEATNIVDAEPEKTRVEKTVELTRSKCNAADQAFAEHWASCGNKAKSYRLAMGYNVKPSVPTRGHLPSREHYHQAIEYGNRPHVVAYFDALKSLAAERCLLDVERILKHDFAIVTAWEQGAANSLTSYVWMNCRYCWGAAGEYQWIDEKEFTDAVARWFVDIASVPPGKPTPARPSDEGGYGFHDWNEPNADCRRCKGLGEQRGIVADTTKLEGAAAVLYRGIKQTANGIEVLTHDVDKAKERLLKAARVYGDSASEVAKGAAAGAAAGAASAQAITRTAVVAEQMTDEQAARAYLELAG
jgi:hypothetical protein